MGGNDQNRAEKQNVVLTWFRPVTWSSGHLGRRIWRCGPGWHWSFCIPRVVPQDCRNALSPKIVVMLSLPLSLSLSLSISLYFSLYLSLSLSLSPPFGLLCSLPLFATTDADASGPSTGTNQYYEKNHDIAENVSPVLAPHFLNSCHNVRRMVCPQTERTSMETKIHGESSIFPSEDAGRMSDVPASHCKQHTDLLSTCISSSCS